MTMIGRSRQVLDVLISEAQRLGVFERVNTHEAKSAPGRGLYCSIWLQKVETVSVVSGLNKTSVRLIWLARLQSSFLAEPQDGIDPNLLDAADLFLDAMHGDLDVSGHVLTIDVFGLAGVPLMGQAGYVDQDGKKFRVMDIQVPVLLDDVWTQVN